jgi:hypothetical protein
MDTGAARTEMVFIAAGVTDSDALLAGRTAAREIVWLDADSDGVLQIAAALGGTERGGQHPRRFAWPRRRVVSRYGDLVACHPGQLPERTGGDQARPCGRMATSLLYGCNMSPEAARGATLVNALADATGADVAASTNATGAAALGGDWTLEAASGPIESAGFAAETVLPAYPGLLADDYPDDPSTPGRVAVGGSATGDIETTGDRDWFAVNWWPARAT